MPARAHRLAAWSCGARRDKDDGGDSMTHRLPPLFLAATQYRIPVSDATWQALLAALAEPKGTASLDGISDALALDPALALWAGFHHSQQSAAAGTPPCLRDLATWLVPRLPALFLKSSIENSSPDDSSASESTTATLRQTRSRRQRPSTRSADSDRASWAQWSAHCVGLAESAASASARLTSPRYLTELLKAAIATPQAGLPSFSLKDNAAVAGWTGWLSSIIDEVATAERAKGRSRSKIPGGKSAIPRGARSKARLSAAKKKIVSQRSALARSRWNQPAAGAIPVAVLAARLARLAQLETRFDERLEEEKLVALAEFAAGAGHEINNPLAVISGRAQLFLREERDPERQRELAVINSQARRVHEMIADLMLFARPPQPKLSQCDVAATLHSIAAELLPRANLRSVKLSYVEPDSLPPVLADPKQIEVAVRACCENAIDAVADGGRVEISAAMRGPVEFGDLRDAAVETPAGGFLAISIRDNGPGISSEVRRNLFDPFFSGRGAGRGLGMGLSKCWRIITNHGGRVEVDTTPQRGTSITLLLPLVKSPAADPRPAAR